MCATAPATICSLIASNSTRRTSVTSRDIVLSPGSGTRLSISHSTARSNRSRRESRVLATRETCLRSALGANARTDSPRTPDSGAASMRL
jgi:hypothetical protein